MLRRATHRGEDLQSTFEDDTGDQCLKAVGIQGATSLEKCHLFKGEYLGSFARTRPEHNHDPMGFVLLPRLEMLTHLARSHLP